VHSEGVKYMQLDQFENLSKKIETIIREYDTIKKDKEKFESQMLKKDREKQEIKKQLDTLVKERDIIKRKLDGLITKIETLGLI